MIRVLFFASLREAAGAAELLLPADAAAREALGLDGLMAALKPRLGAAACAALAADNVRIAVNQELTDGAIALRAGDEVAFLPPVTGG